MADINSVISDVQGVVKGELTKLLIESYSDKERQKGKRTFSAFINPDEYSLTYNAVIDKTNIPGKNANANDVFLHVQPLEVTLKFFLDGTNVVIDKSSGKKLDVPQKIGEFNQVIGYDGDVHKVRYLRLTWGKAAWLRANQSSFDCFLKSASFQYKMFSQDGTPLRVIITATFTEVLSEPIAQAEDAKKSPDLTHVRVVKEGDTLPSLSQDIYGDFKYYLEVARANNLQNFRDLQPGQKLFFPPFDKNIKTSANA